MEYNYSKMNLKEFKLILKKKNNISLYVLEFFVLLILILICFLSFFLNYLTLDLNSSTFAITSLCLLAMIYFTIEDNNRTHNPKTILLKFFTDKEISAISSNNKLSNFVEEITAPINDTTQSKELNSSEKTLAFIILSVLALIPLYFLINDHTITLSLKENNIICDTKSSYCIINEKLTNTQKNKLVTCDRTEQYCIDSNGKFFNNFNFTDNSNIIQIHPKNIICSEFAKSKDGLTELTEKLCFISYQDKKLWFKPYYSQDAFTLKNLLKTKDNSVYNLESFITENYGTPIIGTQKYFNDFIATYFYMYITMFTLFLFGLFVYVKKTEIKIFNELLK